VWDATTGTILAGPLTEHRGEVTSVAFSPDGQRIASALNDRTICVWNAITGEVVAGPFTGHIDLVLSVAFSPDGQRIASGSADFTIRVWDVPSETRLIPEHTKSIDSVAFSLDERHITTLQDRTNNAEKHPVRVRDIEKIDFMNKFVINNDGWMCGEEGELLLWIPEIHRPYFLRSNTVWIAGQNETWLELANFVHGSNWTRVYAHNLSK
jgi:WD40 repeat protein